MAGAEAALNLSQSLPVPVPAAVASAGLVVQPLSARAMPVVEPEPHLRLVSLEAARRHSSPGSGAPGEAPPSPHGFGLTSLLRQRSGGQQAVPQRASSMGDDKAKAARRKSDLDQRDQEKALKGLFAHLKLNPKFAKQLAAHASLRLLLFELSDAEVAALVQDKPTLAVLLPHVHAVRRQCAPPPLAASPPPPLSSGGPAHGSRGSLPESPAPPALARVVSPGSPPRRASMFAAWTPPSDLPAPAPVSAAANPSRRFSLLAALGLTTAPAAPQPVSPTQPPAPAAAATAATAAAAAASRPRLVSPLTAAPAAAATANKVPAPAPAPPLSPLSPR